MKRKKQPEPAPAGIPAINCAHTEMRATAAIQPNPRNPNKHGPEQLRLYAKILRHQGWRKAIVISRQSGFVVTGHGAWMTAVAEAWPLVPVDLQDFQSPADEFAHMLADNRLPQMSEINDAELSAILASELEGKLDLELAGILAEDEKEPEKAAQFPIVAQLLERHDYVLVFCDNEMDFQFLQQLCGCRTEKSYKKKTVGLGRAIAFKRFMESVRANRDSLNEPVHPDNDAQVIAPVSGVRAGQPG